MSTATICTALWGATDTTGIEELFVSTIAVAKPNSKLENVDAFEKERPLLGEKRLERRQVHLGRVCLDLSEVRIHRGG